MRDIKFRGKKINSGEWIYGAPVFEGDKAWIVKRIGDNFSADEVHPETVGQYIGLDNIKDQKIFKDDLCQLRNTIYQIVWDAKYTKFGAKVIKCDHVLPRGCTFLINDYVDMETSNLMLEVIGNIHDNPELLQPQGGNKQ
ncbi:YopX family protein [Paenibacillus sp. S02]|uniref:YopX family protein n=1 Tax=Paenibacillus sp. S02 TaxID=2823904 RepID=UPI001C64BC24|nr:YopX family protein [Paenibacillus sp. S02]QYK68294.1 YopX protein [Paenibacillus sp. S02]